LDEEPREEESQVAVEEESSDKLLKRLLELDEQAEADTFMPSAGKIDRLFVYDELLLPEVLKRYLDKPHLEMVARMPRFRLLFPKYFPPRKTGLASIDRSPEQGDEVWGVTIDVTGQDISRLDRYKAVPNRYHYRGIYVQDRGGLRFPAVAYAISFPDKEPSKPSSELKELILAGASERSLPENYIEFLKSLPVLE